MSDNVEANPGTGGAVFRSDDVGAGVQVPFAKLMDGTDGSSAVIPGDATNGLFVQVKTSALPSGAATAAKQPALGTAGSASADVITVQGVVSMTALKVDGSAVAQPVTDNAGSLTVDNGGTFSVQASAIVPGTGATNLGKAEDTAHTSGDVGVMGLNVRNDSRGTLADTNGDYAPGQLNASGDLRVDASAVAVPVTDNAGSLTVDNGGTFAVQAAQSGTWTVQPGNTANTTAWKVDASSVAVPITDNSGSLTVDNGGTFAVQATIAAGATSIAKAEDTASADADVGIPALAVRKATPANTSGTDGDYEFLQMSAGRLWVDPSGVTLTVASHAVTNAGTFAVQAGQAAHDAAIAGSPVRTAGRALTADYTAVSTGDTADLITTVLGKQIVLPYALPGATWKYVGAAGGLVTTSAITIKTAGGAGVVNYITSILLVNSHQTIGTEIVINDGAAGTAIFRTWCQFAGGGCFMKCDPPLASTANTLLEIKEITTTATAGVVAEIIGYSAAE